MTKLEPRLCADCTHLQLIRATSVCIHMLLILWARWSRWMTGVGRNSPPPQKKGEKKKRGRAQESNLNWAQWCWAIRVCQADKASAKRETMRAEISLRETQLHSHTLAPSLPCTQARIDSHTGASAWMLKKGFSCLRWAVLWQGGHGGKRRRHQDCNPTVPSRQTDRTKVAGRNICYSESSHWYLSQSSSHLHTTVTARGHCQSKCDMSVHH